MAHFIRLTPMDGKDPVDVNFDYVTRIRPHKVERNGEYVTIGSDLHLSRENPASTNRLVVRDTPDQIAPHLGIDPYAVETPSSMYRAPDDSED